MKVMVHPIYGLPPLEAHRMVRPVREIYRVRRGMGAAAPSVTIQNLSGGSAAQFHVGDYVQVSAIGPPNQPVSLTGTLNGSPFPGSTLGSTDANGNFTWSAPVANAPGVYTESWTVGGQPAGTFTFTVEAVPGAAPPAAPAAGGPAPAAGTVSTGTPPPAPAASGILGWLTDPAQAIIGGFPNWMPVVAIVGLFMFSGKGKR